MTATCVLFIQGGGKGAYHEDAPLADSLKRALGPEYDVRYPQMPDEADPNVESWKRNRRRVYPVEIPRGGEGRTIHCRAVPARRAVMG